MKLKNYLPLILILAISFILKLFQLSSPALFGDELDVGNQAYSLSQTLKDYNGNFLPSYMDSFSESRAPFLMYLTAPFVKVLGLNYLSVRLPSLIFSTLTLLFFYLLLQKLHQNKTLSLLSTSILAFSPAFFHYSRLAFESQLLLLLILSATYFYLKEKHLLSFILFALSFYTYNTANIFVPLLAIFLFASSFKTIKNKKSYFLKLAPAILILLPLAFQILFGSASNRFSLISIFSSDNQALVEVKRSSAQNPYSLSERLYHNRPLEITKNFTQNYLSSLSIENLFLHADPNPRQSIPGFALFLLPLVFTLSFLFLSKIKSNKLFIYWLFISPLASSLTQTGAYHTTRLFLILPALAYFLGLSLYSLLQRSKLAFLLITTLSIFSFSSFFHELHQHYPKDSFESWGYGYQELFSNLPQHQRLFISNTNYDLLSPYVFYQKVDPRLLQDPEFTDQPQDNIISNFTDYTLGQDNYFITNWQGDTLQNIKDFAQSGDLFILRQLKDIPGDMNLSDLENFQLINQIRDPYQNLLYQVILKQ